MVGPFDVRSCEACASLFTAALPEPEDAHDYEAYYDEANLTVPEFVESRLEEIVAAFEPYRRLNRWLDVGCGAGTLMRAATTRGWQVTGTEVAGPAVERLLARGFDVLPGDLDELALPDRAFDVISAVEVLEHVADPGGLLTQCARLLQPGGALYVTTPHGRGISARVLRGRWSVVAPPEHLQLFSVAGLRLAARRAGLTERSLRTHAVEPRELLEALRPRRGERRPAMRVESSYRLNASLSSGPGVMAKRLANGLLNRTRLGDGIRFVAERRSPVTSPRV